MAAVCRIRADAPLAPLLTSNLTMSTLPQRLREALETPVFKTVKELSVELHVSEKELPTWLEKLDRSLKHQTCVLEVEPARCLACAFLFEERSRFTKPSRCPNCRSERISPPRFRCVARAP
jgi:transcriptional regulator